MSNNQLFLYVLKSLDAGVDKSQIQSALMVQGWSEAEIVQTITEAEQKLNAKKLARLR